MAERDRENAELRAMMEQMQKQIEALQSTSKV